MLRESFLISNLKSESEIKTFSDKQNENFQKQAYTKTKQKTNEQKLESFRKNENESKYTDVQEGMNKH